MLLGKLFFSEMLKSLKKMHVDGLQYLSHKSTPSSPLRCATGTPSFPRGDGFWGVPRAKWVIPERVTWLADRRGRRSLQKVIVAGRCVEDVAPYR